MNDRMETSVPDIYAAGDAVQVKHYITGNDALISLAGPANKQGRIIADNICGGDSRYLGSQGSSVIKVFDMTAATTGKMCIRDSLWTDALELLFCYGFLPNGCGHFLLNNSFQEISYK